MPVLASHPVPRGRGPAIIGTIVVAAALPVFLADRPPDGEEDRQRGGHDDRADDRGTVAPRDRVGREHRHQAKYSW